MDYHNSASKMHKFPKEWQPAIPAALLKSMWNQEELINSHIHHYGDYQWPVTHQSPSATILLFETRTEGISIHSLRTAENVLSALPKEKLSGHTGLRKKKDDLSHLFL